MVGKEMPLIELPVSFFCGGLVHLFPKFLQMGVRETETV